jgi:hypothetical protein
MLVFVFYFTCLSAIIFPTVIEAIEMITISWNAGEISAFMIVSNLNKVAIADFANVLIKAVVKVEPLHKHQAQNGKVLLQF